MMRFSYTSIIGSYENLHEKEKLGYVPRVKAGNPDWEIFQLLRQIQLSINIARGVKRNYMMNNLNPPDMRNFYERTPTWSECDLFEKIMNKFYDYIKENEKDFTSNVRAIEDLVNTVCLVKDNRVELSSIDSDLVKEIKEVAKNYDFNFFENDRDSILFVKEDETPMNNKIKKGR